MRLDKSALIWSMRPITLLEDTRIEAAMDQLYFEAEVFF